MIWCAEIISDNSPSIAATRLNDMEEVYDIIGAIVVVIIAMVILKERRE